MAETSEGRQDAVARLYPLFRDMGYAATLSDCATATGLSRSSLYHYFPGGKQEMAKAALAHVELWIAENVVAVLSDTTLAPLQRLKSSHRSLRQLYVDGTRGCLLGAFSFGEARAIFQHQLSSVAAEWIVSLTGLAIEAGSEAPAAKRWAENAVIVIQGSLIVSALLERPKLLSTQLDEIVNQFTSIKPAKPWKRMATGRRAGKGSRS